MKIGALTAQYSGEDPMGTVTETLPNETPLPRRREIGEERYSHLSIRDGVAIRMAESILNASIAAQTFEFTQEAFDQLTDNAYAIADAMIARSTSV